MAVAGVSDVVAPLERGFHDVASIRSSRQPSDRITAITIDDQSIANNGRWPWQRHDHGGSIDKLSAKAAARAHAEAVKTLVLAGGITGAPGDGGATATSYDPPAKAAAADDPFARTAVFGRPGGPAHPAGGEGQSGSEG